MWISEIINNSKICEKISIQNEIAFDYLGLIASECQGTLCTFLEDLKYLHEARQENIMFITTEEIAKSRPELSAVSVENPRLTFFLIHNYLVDQNREYKRKSFKTKVGQNCKISRMALIAGENVILGDRVEIEEFVSIKENSVIGNDTIIRAGSIIGGEGFEEKRGSDTVISVKHAGGVIIGEHVEIQQNTCIDKGIYPWSNTMIGDYCKLDNLIHIAHAVNIDRETLIAASTFIGGRTTIGKKVWIGPGVTVINNIEIGNKAKVSLGAVVTKNVEENERVTGNFAIPHDEFIAQLKITKNSRRREQTF